MGAACGALCGQGDRRPGRIATKEGDPVARAFIVRFETYEQALACYEDPTYQVAATFGKQASPRDVVILAGGCVGGGHGKHIRNLRGESSHDRSAGFLRGSLGRTEAPHQLNG